MLAPYTRMVLAVSCTIDAWKWVASCLVPTWVACSANPVISASTAAIRAVAAPTPRRLFSQSAPGAAVNTVGAIAASCGYNCGVKPCEPRIRSG
ncbi:Uncharacterised protein [Mycobacterium tuberculosis]|nr:Uncharacterised protein [Mycobacterium tuberculosis]